MPIVFTGPDGVPLEDQEAAREEFAAEQRTWWEKEHAEKGIKTFSDVVKLLAFLREANNIEDISWRISEDMSSIVFMVDSSDLFAWGYANADSITVADIPEMQRAFDDLEAAQKYSGIYWPMLFLSRREARRVQYAQYKRLPDAVKPLFKAVSDEPGYAWPKGA